MGYTAAGGTVAGTVAGLSSTPIPDEINYSGGVELVANPRFTLIGDVVGRTLRKAGRLDVVSKSFEYNEPTILLGTPGPGCGGFVGFTCRSVSLDEFAPRSGNLRLLLGTGGVKFNVAGKRAHLGKRAVSTQQSRPSEPPHNGDRNGLRVLVCHARWIDGFER
jgi:hypothetical protein